MSIFNPCKEGKHKFKPRYDREPPKEIDTLEGSGSVRGFLEIIDSLTKETYIYDICVRCGKKERRI